MIFALIILATALMSCASGKKTTKESPVSKQVSIPKHRLDAPGIESKRQLYKNNRKLRHKTMRNNAIRNHPID